MRTILLISSSLLMAAASVCQAQETRKLYRLESTLVIKSENKISWDYLTYDPLHDYLYISRHADGILIYDAKAKQIIGAIGNSTGGNDTELAPDLDRGFVINNDGSATVFEHSTLKALKRVSFGNNADSGTYDPVTKQIAITLNEDGKIIYLDARDGSIVGELKLDSKKIEGTAADGEGNMFSALRDRNTVVRVDARAHRVTATWPTVGCELPNGLQYDRQNKRVFVSCRGDRPVLLVLDAASGQVVASTPIGRGNDVLVWDSDAHKIYTSNGYDGSLVIIDQIDANTYRLSEATLTRPYAKTMALDPRTKRVYLVTAEGTVDATKPWRSEITPFFPNTYFKDTFTLLTYAPQ